MYRILIYDNLKESTLSSSFLVLEPLSWFDGTYSHNILPFPLLYNRNQLIHSKSEKLILEKGQHYIELNINDIIRIESHIMGSTIYMADRNFWTTQKQIDAFENEFGNEIFFRVHENHLINIKFLECLVECDSFITLSSSGSIPVDSVYKKKLINYLEESRLL